MSNFTTTISVRYDFEPLSRTNWVTWVAHVRDWLEGQEAKGAKPIWDEYESTVKAAQDDDEHEPHDYQNEAQPKRTYHNKCWQYVRKHLSSNMFAKVQNFKPKSVPLLMLSLKDICCDGSDVERAIINDKYRAMRASDYDNIDDYNTAFLAIVRVMTDLKMGDTLGPHSNSALAYQYERGLGPSYDNAKMIRQSGRRPTLRNPSRWRGSWPSTSSRQRPATCRATPTSRAEPESQPTWWGTTWTSTRWTFRKSGSSNIR